LDVRRSIRGRERYAARNENEYPLHFARSGPASENWRINDEMAD